MVMEGESVWTVLLLEVVILNSNVDCWVFDNLCLFNEVTINDHKTIVRKSEVGQDLHGTKV